MRRRISAFLSFLLSYFHLISHFFKRILAVGQFPLLKNKKQNQKTTKDMIGREKKLRWQQMAMHDNL